MRTIAEASGASLRPHVKTHKCRELLHIQQEVGGAGPAIVVSTLREAEFFADAGIVDDIILGVPLDMCKLGRSLDVARRVRSFGLLIDSAEVLESLENALDLPSQCAAVSSLISPLQLWLEIDTGYHRCGIDVTTDLAPAVKLVQAIVHSGCKHIAFAGLYAHSGHSYNCCPSARDPGAARAAAASIAGFEGDRAAALASELKMLGVVVPCVSLGATPSVSSGAMWPRAALGGTRLELHPGNYTLYDRQQV
jgi:D-serine deaminase-like pyridoxal phosphate-dependent protein